MHGTKEYPYPDSIKPSNIDASSKFDNNRIDNMKRRESVTPKMVINDKIEKEIESSEYEVFNIIYRRLHEKN